MVKELPRCCAIVHNAVWGSLRDERMCRNKSRVCREGQYYCGLHDPVAIKERKALKEEQMKPLRALRDFLFRKHYWSSEMLEMLERLAAGENVSSEEARTLAEKYEEDTMQTKTFAKQRQDILDSIRDAEKYSFTDNLMRRAGSEFLTDLLNDLEATLVVVQQQRAAIEVGRKWIGDICTKAGIELQQKADGSYVQGEDVPTVAEVIHRLRCKLACEAAPKPLWKPVCSVCGKAGEYELQLPTDIWEYISPATRAIPDSDRRDICPECVIKGLVLRNRALQAKWSGTARYSWMSMSTAAKISEIEASLNTVTATLEENTLWIGELCSLAGIENAEDENITPKDVFEHIIAQERRAATLQSVEDICTKP